MQRSKSQDITFEFMILFLPASYVMPQVSLFLRLSNYS